MRASTHTHTQTHTHMYYLALNQMKSCNFQQRGWTSKTLS